MYVVLTLLSIVPVLILVQMVRLTWIEGSDLRAQGVRQASDYEKIPAMRGAILDRSGRTLVINTAQYDLAVDPTVDGFSEREAAFLRTLSRLTGTPVDVFRRRIRDRRSPRYVLLERNLSEAHKEQLEDLEIPGLLLDARFARRYNYGTTASHLLGHVDVDLRGIAGLELKYEEFLGGVDGRRAIKRDRRRNMKADVGGAVVQPRHGENLVMTIDLIRQTILEEELLRGVQESGATWGTAIAMDPHTGAILAMANMPTYDPNRAAVFPPNAQRNRGITDRIEPGSTFKLITALAAVEQDIVLPEDSVDTGQGWAVFHGRTLRDTQAHGRISFAEVIAVSSNVGTARVATRLKPGVFYQYARNLGFGQPTWIDLPGEVAGSLKRPSEWSGLTQPWMSIGYEMEATPLQILTAYNALANGGLLVQPYVIAERRDVSGRIVWRARADSIRRAFKAETARRLLPMFERVVEEGTARRAQVEGLRIAGKTGTAQKASGGGYNRNAYRASFVGFFPAENPAVSMVVILDEPRSSGYGGAVAAPIFQRIAQRWIGTFPNIAEQMAPVEPFPPVVDRPEPTVVRVSTEEPRTMPDLKGLSVRQAVVLLSSIGIRAEVRGSGVVASQSPAPGGTLPETAVLQCR